jgi:predicted lipoprotein with Yx(FWY)xxD motif
LHPFADEAGEVRQAEDTVSVRANDHALCLDLGHNGRAAEPLPEGCALGGGQLKEKIRVYAVGKAGLVRVVELTSAGMEKHTAPRFARRSIGVVAASTKPAWGQAGIRDCSWRGRQQTAFPRRWANAEVGHNGLQIALPKAKGVDMTRRKPVAFLATLIALPLTVVALAGCGGGGNKASTTPVAPKTANGAPATVGVANVGLGKILVNSRGRTLYLFQKDSGTTSACSGACAVNWPPLRATGKPTLGSGADSSLVGTTTRSDGRPQVTYNGHPLYLFSGDAQAGDTNGEGANAFGGLWYAVSPAGNQVVAAAPSTGY